MGTGIAVASAAAIGFAYFAVPALAGTVGVGSVGPAAQAGPPPAQFPVVASGLDNPRGLTVASNGDIYVAESGHGGDGACIPSADSPGVQTCFGATGAIAQIHDGAVEQVVTGLPSLAPQVPTQNGQLPPGAEASGPSDVIVLPSGKVVFTIGLGSDPANRDSKLVSQSSLAALMGTLSSSSVPGDASSVTKIADVSAFETAKNPVPPENAPDSNPNAVIADGSGYAVVDAGGNDLLAVDSDGTVSLTTTFPSAKQCPPPPVTPQAVPTSATRGPDGALYVGELTGFPFCEGGAAIYKVVDGTATVYASGLTNVTGLSFASDGTLYATEIAQFGLQKGPMGAVVAIPNGGGTSMADYRLVAAGLLAPYGIAVDGDSAYVTVGSILPATAGGGSVVKIPLDSQACSPFPDVSGANGFCADVTWLKEHGITQGYADGSFHPTDSVTRQSMAAFLSRLEHSGSSAPACTDGPFPDVSADNVFCADVAWLKAQGITQGYADGDFHPTDDVTRQSMAAFLYRLAHSGGTAPACTDSPFPDVSADNMWCGAIAWLKAQGITQGYADGNFHPTDHVARQSMAAFLHRFAGAVS